MLNMKKGLAIVLAAATALTFAPVSTLGLTGVVEAQAANATADAVTKTLDWSKVTGTSNKESASISADIETAATLAPTLTISGLASTDYVTFTDTDTTSVTAKLGSQALSTTAANVGSNGEKITFTVPNTAKSGKVEVKVEDAQTATKAVTYTINFTVTNSKAAVKFTSDADGKTAVSSYSMAKNNAATTVDVYATAYGTADEPVYLYSSDPSVVVPTFDGGTATDGTVNAQAFTATAKQLKLNAKKEGTATVTLKAGDKTATLAVTVLGTMTTTAATVSDSKAAAPSNAISYPIGNVTLTGTNYSSTEAANKPGKGTLQANVTAITPGANAADITAAIGDVSVASATSASFPINVTTTSAAKVGNQYKVTVTGTVEGKTVNKDITVTIVSAPESQFATGGVLNSIYAYKGATYDLAEHASVIYAGVGETPTTYSGSELMWFLVDSSTNPKVGQQRTDLKSIELDASAGTVASGAYGSLKVSVADAQKLATAVDSDGHHTKVVAEAVIKGVRTVVYVGGQFSAEAINTNPKSISSTITDSVTAKGVKDSDKKLDVLNDKIANPTEDNKYLTADKVYDAAVVQTDTHYTLTLNKGTGSGNPFAGSYLTLKDASLTKGTYYETAVISFKVNGDTTNTTYYQKVEFVINVNTGVNFRVKDGTSILTSTYVSDNGKIAKDHTVYLDLVANKTWNIKDHTETDAADPSKVSYTYSSDSANVDVDSKGVLTAKSEGNAEITINATYNGIKSADVKLSVRVNKNAFDTLTVTGKDGDQARVLNVRDYDNNTVSGRNGEAKLVTKQIPYVQIEITGNETTDVVETPVVKSANNAALSYAFVQDYTSDGLSIDPSTGKISIDYNKCIPADSSTLPVAIGTYAVKVVSAATSTSAATTSYYYVVVDYPDKTISGLQDNYTVGTCTDSDDEVPAAELYVESKGTADKFAEVDKTSEADQDFNGIGYYKDDNTKVFNVAEYTTTHDAKTGVKPSTPVGGFKSDGIILKATSVNQTMHVVAYNAASPSNRTGYTAKLITVKSAAAVDNYVEKITNKDTGEVLYDHSVNATDTARELKIDKATTIQVTLAHPVASVVSGSAVGLKIKPVSSDGSSVINQDPFVTAVKNSKQVDVALYPNTKGTTVIEVGPSGHLTATDRTDIHQKSVRLAITYTGENASVTKPAKVTGVKLGNKKGAKVVVKFNKDNTSKNIKYYVQKKVGKKTSGKSVGSNRTILSVAKGKTVKVRVKAYYYDANGLKHVGKYSKWVTKKTDKK